MGQTLKVRTARAVVLLTALLVVLGRVLPPQDREIEDYVGAIGNGLFILACAVVGLVIVVRRPHNRVGWIYVLIALGLSVADFAGTYAGWTQAEPSLALPGGLWAALLVDPLWAVAVAPGVALLLLLFPTGRLPSPGWRMVVWLLFSSGLVVATFILLTPGPVPYFPGARNPLGLEGHAAAVAGTQQAANVLLTLSLLAAAMSLIARWRRARGIERQQMRWLAFAAVTAVLVYAVTASLTPILLGRALPQVVNQVVFATVSLLFPVASAVAILRHRLYDIDRIVSRTIVYGALTAALGAMYTLVVLLLGGLYGGTLTDPPEWTVAVATLASATLFGPIRRRLQRLVARRFNRRRYDAVRTVEAFSIRLRQEVDLQALTEELSAVVSRVMEPTTVALWLLPPSQLPASSGPRTAG